MHTGVIDLSVPFAYEASLVISGGSPEEAAVWMVDGNASNFPGNTPSGELAGLPTPERPRLSPLTQQADNGDGSVVFGIDLITEQEAEFMSVGIVGAQLGTELETFPLTIGVKPDGAPTFHFLIDACFGCLLPDGCAWTRTCRPAQDEPNGCL